jgi:antibiotic biosynthesis monooxygenase (ABM) superfamily enzyme
MTSTNLKITPSPGASCLSKACLIPACENKKFNLVHKFPSDRERFNEWLAVIQRDNLIEKLQGLTEDVIRKRYFICSRHFAPKEYKNSGENVKMLT